MLKNCMERQQIYWANHRFFGHFSLRLGIFIYFVKVILIHTLVQFFPSNLILYLCLFIAGDRPSKTCYKIRQYSLKDARPSLESF